MTLSNPFLCEAISQIIAISPQKRITFAEYMDLVLYHPEHGYYSTKAANIGKQGDFFTSVHLGSDFGELLAEQFVHMWEVLGRPTPFSLVEMGAGQGLLALDIVSYVKQQYSDFFHAIDYVIVEKSSLLKGLQQQRLQEFSVRWCSLEEIPKNSVIGCFFSNELVDAFPVHQFVVQQGQILEVYVTSALSSSFPFTELIDTPSTPQLVEYFDLVGVDVSGYIDEYRSEVNLAALHWLSTVAECLQRGYLLTIDYGYPAHRYYNPRRSQGTLQCYYQHHRHNDPYINIGEQDITAHVDFTALERWGEKCGLVKVGFTEQALFLMALGLGARIASISYTQQPVSQLLKRRDALHQLLDPLGLGGFGVLAQSKGLTKEEAAQPLRGFIVPELKEI
ncbi:MAG: class I SAM-dependent methyltransferase [Scytonema sp. PMC 1069.18]|nr:class I SAM-dependent methyltransferase [Scytonema sp. PMC 1069.18]MEC4885236.1 class I SAM-dependent methyltransferase [Scytonema sp. PMC 1070.18]